MPKPVRLVSHTGRASSASGSAHENGKELGSDPVGYSAQK